MANKLMIVESPSKCGKIKKFLKDIDPDSTWDVEASVGHIQDLNKDKNGKFGSLGIDKETLELDYKLSKKGADVIKDLRNKIKNKGYVRIVLASDPDREGEAIAEHLRIRLGLGENYDRCTFNEITKTAVAKALEEPSKVNKDLIKAQDTRRILDRVVGWEATTAISRAVNQKTPIGRVISQAVKMIVDREREINNFVEQEHYSVKALFDNEGSPWTAELDIKKSNLLKDGEDYWKDKELAQKITDAIKGGNLKVIESEKKEKKRFAPPAFETSTMQQAALNKLGFKGKHCDSIAQKLYQDGHITYIRTDSTVISQDGFSQLQKYAKSKGYPVFEEPRQGKKGKVEQEAHECIRPTDFSFEGEGLSKDEKALYDMIKTRCIASQLEPAIYNVVELLLETDDGHIFKASGSTLVEKGWRNILDGDDSEEEEEDETASNPVPLLDKGTTASPTDSQLLVKKTKKPPRLTQATLGAMLKKNGIGRPATYSSIYEKIGESQHGYVSEKGKCFQPNTHAETMVEVTEDALCIMDTKFTMQMEEHLDEIANGKVEGDKYVFDFFKTLEQNLEEIVKKHTVPDTKCLSCGEMTLRRLPKKVKNQYFWACMNEDCAKTFSDKDGKPVDFESQFYNEDGTPKEPCPDCGKALFLISPKSGQWWVCSSGKEKCGFITGNTQDNKPDFEARKRREEWQKKIEEAHNPDGTPIHPCPECGKALIKNTSAKGATYFKCSARKADCDYFTMADDDGEPKTKEDSGSGGKKRPKPKPKK